MAEPAPHDPSLAEVHTDLVKRLDHDQRIRQLEVSDAHQQATMDAVREEVRGLREDGKQDKAELLAAIGTVRDAATNRARNAPAWVAAAAAVVVPLVTLLLTGVI